MIIRSFEEFWNKIKSVDQVVVYALSYGEVDVPYLGKVLEMVAEGTPWHLSYYSCSDRVAAENLIKTLAICNTRVFQY